MGFTKVKACFCPSFVPIMCHDFKLVQKFNLCFMIGNVFYVIVL